MRTGTSPKIKRRRPALITGAWLLCALLPTAAPARCAEATTVAGSIEDLWSRGETAFKAGDLAGALRLFDAARTGDERRARSWNYVGGVHFAQGNFSRALADFRKALELDPRDVRACNNIGTALERLGEYSGAETSYAQAVFIDPSYPLTQRNLGILHARLKNPDAARRAWERYLELAPTGAHADEIRRELATFDASAPPATSPSSAAPTPIPALVPVTPAR